MWTVSQFTYIVLLNIQRLVAMVTVSKCRRLSLQIVSNSDSQPKSGSIGAEDTIYIFVSTLRCTRQFICDTLLTTDYSIQRVLYTYYKYISTLLC